jgi:hypothetical protein
VLFLLQLLFDSRQFMSQAKVRRNDQNLFGRLQPLLNQVGQLFITTGAS